MPRLKPRLCLRSRPRWRLRPRWPRPRWRSRRRTRLLATPVLQAAVAVLMALTVFGCSNRGELVLRGSDTMAPLAQAWAQSFHALNPEWDVAVAGGGSGVGLAALLDGTAAVALSSRPAAPDEEAQAAAGGYRLRSILAGYDGIAIIVPATNPVAALTLDEVRQLFTGEIDNWRAVGGPDQLVVPIGREGTSGTHDSFAALVLGDAALADRALLLPSHRATVVAVAQTPGAIGYVSLAHVGDGVKALALAAGGSGSGPGESGSAADGSGQAVAPSAESIATGQYSLARPLWLYVREPAPPEAEQFLEHVLSPTGQVAVQRAGYVPVDPIGGKQQPLSP